MQALLDGIIYKVQREKIMVKSKEWEWNEADKSFWTNPCEDSKHYHIEAIKN